MPEHRTTSKTKNAASRPKADRSTAASTDQSHPIVSRVGPIILAADGASASDSQAITASLIAEHLGVPLIVTTVMRPELLYTGSDGGVGSFPIILNSELSDAQSDTVRRYMESAVGADRQWELDVRTGSIARGVVESARDHRASLIVVGAGRLAENARRIRGGRALQILRQSPYPVLSVTHELSGLPHHALAAIDFGVPSLNAAQAALTCLDDTAVMTMLHIFPTFPELVQNRPTPKTDYNALFDRARNVIQAHPPSNAKIETRVEGGPTTEVILSQAEMVDADLIALGTHSPGFVERFFVGSVAANILHFSPVSVLISPRPAPLEALRLTLGMEGTAETTAPENWGPVLDEFSTRNMGRRVSLEVDEIEIGGQMQVNGYILHGVTYDPRDRRIDIMLSRSSANMPHLTRMIEDIDSIAIRRSGDRDSVLEIRHDGGYTLLTFE